MPRRSGRAGRASQVQDLEHVLPPPPSHLFFVQMAIFDGQDAIDLLENLFIVSRDERGGARIGGPPQSPQHSPTPYRVLMAGRLVGKQQPRTADQGPGEPGSLLLAERDLGGGAIGELS